MAQIWWISLILFQSALAWIVCPIMLFFYESNERNPIQQRIVSTLKEGLLIFLCIVAFFLGTGLFSRDIWIPSEIAASIGEIAKNEFEGQLYFTRETSPVEHIMISAAFIGSFFFVIFTGVGLVALPWDLFVDYQYRPKMIDSEEFDKRKQVLLIYALELRETGKELAQNNNYSKQVKGLEGIRARAKFSN